MDVVTQLRRAGGVAGWADLVAVSGRYAVEQSVRDGRIERLGRGRYALTSASSARKAAALLGGVVSMRSAAQLHGWSQRWVPELPDVTVPRNRRVSPRDRRFAVPHWSDLPPEDVVRGVTSPRRTLVDCMRMLALNESLPIVESALRNGDIGTADLRSLAAGMRGRGRARAMGVAAMADPRTANAYESVLRAIISTVPGLDARPQYPIRMPNGVILHPDFADPVLGIVIEAESFSWHGEAAALSRDCERYNAFTMLGWVVIRFSWSQVMFSPAYVLSVLAAVVSAAREHANVA